MGDARKNYGITGGPCAGKTAVTEGLRKDGFIIVPEAARLVKRRNRRFGGPQPEKNFEDFEEDVLDAQTRLDIKHRSVVRFHDRTFCDNIAYYNFNHITAPQFLMEMIDRYRFDKIFYLSQLNFYTQDKYRLETKEEADMLQKLIRESYYSHGYDIIEIPFLPVCDRIQIIKGHIQGDLEILSSTLGCTAQKLKGLK